MNDQNKTKAELLGELAELRQEVARLKATEAECVELKRRQAEPKPEGVSINTMETDRLVQELVRERDLLQALLDNAPDWIFFKDAQSRIIKSNKTHAQVLGLNDPQQAIGKTDFDFFPPEDARRFFEEEQEFLKAGQPLIGRVGPTPGPDGEILWRSETKVPLRDDAGQVTGLVGISRDVTAFKQTEAALRRSEERYRALFEDSPISLWEEDFSAIKIYIDQLRRQGISDFRSYFDQHPDVVLVQANMAQVVEVNPTTLRLYQAANKEEFFNRLGEFFREESLVTFKEEMIAIAEGKTKFSGDSIHYTSTGAKIYVSLNWSVAPGYEQSYAKVAVSLVDITERRHTEEVLAKRATELETVTRLSAVASTILDAARLLQEVADLTKERFGLYHAHIYLLNEVGDRLELTAGAGEVGRQMVAEGWGISLLREKSLVAQAAREQHGVIVNNVHEEPGWLPNPLLPHTRSEMAVPLIVGQRVLGVLDVQSDQTNRFTTEDVQIKSILAAQVAVALDNARHLEQTQLALSESEEQAQRLARLTKMGSQLNQAADEAEIFKVTAVQTPQIVPGSRTSITLLNPAGDSLEILALKGEAGAIPMGAALPLVGTATGTSVREGRPVNISNAQTSEFIDARMLAQQGIRSTLNVPLWVGGQIIGTLNVGSEQINAYSDRDENILSQVGVLLSSALENRRLLKQAQARVQYEQLLRQITARVRVATNPDAIVRAAVRELGLALDRPTFIRLGKPEQFYAPQTLAAQADSPHGNGQETGEK